MAITVTNPTPGKTGFMLNGVSADASLCEVLKAAPAAGLHIIVDHLTINNGAGAQSITIGEDEAANDVVTALLGPIAMAANTSLQWDFSPAGMVLTAAKSLTVDSTSNTALCIFARGRVE